MRRGIAIVVLVVAAAASRVAGAADQVHWTFTGPTSVTFDWRGDDNRVRYGTTASYGSLALGVPPSPMPISSAGPFWEARLTGLRPNSVYHYSIGGGPDRTFRTPVPRGSTGFTIMVEGDIGDSRTYDTVMPVQELIAAARPHFVLGLGDLTYGDDHGQDAVDQHFTDVMVWSEDAAYMPVWGNHEWDTGDDFRNYKGRFDLPNPQTSPGAPSAGCCGEDWYWFDYGNARFIAYPEPYSRAWADWAETADALMAEVDDDPAIQFLVTFGHRPAFSSGHHGGSATLGRHLSDLAERHQKYVLNLNGHSHNYERTHPQSGVVHITAGAGGAALEAEGATNCLWRGGCPSPTWTAYRAFRHGAVQLRFTRDAIEGEALCGPSDPEADVDCALGEPIDLFRIASAVAGEDPPADTTTAAPLLRVGLAPQPVRDVGMLTFTLARSGPVHVTIADVAGRTVRLLRDVPSLEAGVHQVWFEARDRFGKILTPGIYFAVIRAGGEVRSERITVVR